jgi:hypothetical protein
MLVAALSAALCAGVGCSDDDDSDDGTGGTGGTAGSGGAGGSTGGTGGSTGGTGGSTGGTGGSTGGTAGAAGAATGGTAGAAGAAGSAGAAGAAGGANADTFCADYETTCGFGTADHYDNMKACKDAYNSFSAPKQACVVQHLGMATSTTDDHCKHAADIAGGPCDI